MARRKKQETKYLDGNHSLFQIPKYSQYEGMPGMYLITSHFSDTEGRWKVTNVIPSGYSDPLINTVGAVVDVVFETLLGVGGRYNEEKPENNRSANRRVRQVVTALKLGDDEANRLHYAISDRMTYSEIMEVAKEMFYK